MPIDHSNCSHPRTPAGRRACRAGASPPSKVSVDDCLDALVGLDHNTTTGHLNGPVAPADDAAPSWLITARADAGDDYVSFLSTAGYLANGGLIAPGQEWKLAPTGKPGTAKWEIKKTTVHNPHPETNEPRDTAKSITNDRVISEGMYLHDGKTYRVKLSKSSGKPYALLITDGDTWGEYAKGVIFNLRASERIADEPAKTSTVLVGVGFYEIDGNIYKVVKSRGGKLYAKLITEDHPRGAMAPGVIFRLTLEMKLTLETAAAYGKATGRCCICGLMLEVTESIERGIGPICYGKMGF